MRFSSRKKEIISVLAVFLSALLMRLPPYFPKYYQGDSYNYMKCVWSMHYASHIDPISGMGYSFGYPLIIYLFSLFIKNIEHAAVVAAITLGSLSPVILYFIGRRYFGWAISLIAALGLAFFGADINVSTTPLSEGTFIFFSLLAIYALTNGIYKPRPLYYFLITGLLFGYSFLVRPEVQISFLAMAAVGAWLMRKKQGISYKRLAIILAVMFMGFMSTIIPRVIWAHSVSGQWVMEGRKNALIKSIGSLQEALEQGADYPRIKETWEESAYGLDEKGELTAGDPRSFLAWIMEDPGARFRYYWKNVVLSVKNITVPVAIALLFAVISLFATKGRRREKLLYLATYFSPILVISFFFSQGRGSWYSRTGPADVFSPILLLMASCGLWMLLKKIKKPGWKKVFVPATAAVMLAAWSFPAIWNCALIRGWGESPSPNYAMDIEMDVSRWIDENLPKDAKIMVRSWTIGYYCNREREIVPYAQFPELIKYARKKNVKYIVIGGAEFIRPDLEFLYYPEQTKAIYGQDLRHIAEFKNFNSVTDPGPLYLAQIYQVN